MSKDKTGPPYNPYLQTQHEWNQTFIISERPLSNVKSVHGAERETTRSFSLVIVVIQ